MPPSRPLPPSQHCLVLGHNPDRLLGKPSTLPHPATLRSEQPPCRSADPNRVRNGQSRGVMRTRRVYDPPAPIRLVVILQSRRFGDGLVDGSEAVSGVVLG